MKTLPQACMVWILCRPWNSQAIRYSHGNGFAWISKIQQTLFVYGCRLICFGIQLVMLLFSWAFSKRDHDTLLQISTVRCVWEREAFRVSPKVPTQVHCNTSVHTRAQKHLKTHQCSEKTQCTTLQWNTPQLPTATVQASNDVELQIFPGTSGYCCK